MHVQDGGHGIAWVGFLYREDFHDSSFEVAGHLRMDCFPAISSKKSLNKPGLLTNCKIREPPVIVSLATVGGDLEVCCFCLG